MLGLLSTIILGYALHDNSTFNLVVDAPYQIVQPKSTAQFLCQADVPLTVCQVKVLMTNEVIDLSLGKRSPNYWGTGLEHGQCGYTYVNGDTVGGKSFSCRGRSHNGTWAYAEAVIHTPSSLTNGIISVVRTPRKFVVNEGSDVTLSFHAGEPLLGCTFIWPGQKSWAWYGSNSVYSFDGTDLPQGRCRQTLRKVTAAMSGVVQSQINSGEHAYQKMRHAVLYTTLIVKQAPSARALTLNKADGVYIESDVMEASCHVGIARPVARITWMLSNDVVLGDDEDFSTWPWEYETGNVTQKLHRRLTLDDDDKELICQVHHVALPGGVVHIRKKISVRKAKGSSRYITIGSTGIRLHQSSRSYEDAVKICEKAGGHLAIPRSKEVEDTMVQLLNSTKWQWAFVGVNDLADKGTWITALGERWSDVGHTKWDDGEPSNAGGNEDCTTIRVTGVLNDVNCTEEAAFFCEITQSSGTTGEGRPA